MPGKEGRRGWGAMRKLPSGRWQASYIGPDGARHKAEHTYTSKLDAEAWLAAQRLRIERGEWSRRRPAQMPETFAQYAERWLERRRVKGKPLKPATRALYRRLLDTLILPTFGDDYLASIDPEAIEDWYYSLNPDTPTRRAHTYSLARTIFDSAVRDGRIKENPCDIPGAATKGRASEPTIATTAEVDAIAAAMPERLRMMVTLAAWGAFRYGELAELRRKDINLEAGTVRIARAVGWPDGDPVVETPKTRAGVRTVALPPHVVPDLEDHLRRHVEPGASALLFPAARGGQMPHKAFYRYWHPARDAAGRPDMRFHWLRHTALTLAAQAGATPAELMARAGHADPAAVAIYQHAAAERDRDLAARMSERAGR